jgi:hypothetical protein
MAKSNAQRQADYRERMERKLIESEDDKEAMLMLGARIGAEFGAAASEDWHVLFKLAVGRQQRRMAEIDPSEHEQRRMAFCEDRLRSWEAFYTRRRAVERA